MRIVLRSAVYHNFSAMGNWKTQKSAKRIKYGGMDCCQNCGKAKNIGKVCPNCGYTNMLNDSRHWE